MLFNLEEDPNQINNLAENPEAHCSLQACRGRLDQWMQEERDHSRPAFLQDMALLN